MMTTTPKLPREMYLLPAAVSTQVAFTFEDAKTLTSPDIILVHPCYSCAMRKIVACRRFMFLGLASVAFVLSDD
jgi:hypothetical protein